MKNPTDAGLNRTGIDISPIDSKKMMEEADRTPPSSQGDVQALLSERSVFFQETGEAIGTVPPPGTLRGAASTGMQKLAARKPEVLIDKLAERLAFERSGTRLYEALINKCEARVGGRASIPIERFREFREAEHRHFEMVRQAMKTIGADPTAVTPCADVAAVESLGLLQTITDPRTSISQSVHAILIAELTDQDGWQSLISLAQAMNHSQMAESFQSALAEEQMHLETIRKIYNQLVLEDARVA
jgi:rubrerythrin